MLGFYGFTSKLGGVTSELIPCAQERVSYLFSFEEQSTSWIIVQCKSDVIRPTVNLNQFCAVGISV